jgi:hypothetical protein
VVDFDRVIAESQSIGIELGGIESELIQPKRRFFHSPLTAFR